MHTLSREVLVSVPEAHRIASELPVAVSRALEAVDYSQFGSTKIEQIDAKMTFFVWTSTLLEMQSVIVDQLQGVSVSEKQIFSQAFEKALANFIIHPDHGMLHSYFVYNGMQHLFELETGTKPNEFTDIQIQLLALLHDAFQTLPYQVAGENCGIVSKVQKNDHAMIVAKLVKLFGPQFGISKTDAYSLAFDLAVHDSSYDQQLHPEKISFLGALLHDSDKLFGTATNMHPKNLARGLFHRNATANATSEGAYIMRSELTPDYRKKITYGDRCYSDGFSLALSEINLPMYTDSAIEIRDQRKEYALEELLTVYEEIYNTTAAIIENILVPNFSNRSLQLFAVALGNPSKRLSHINSLNTLKATIDEMYITVLKLPEEYHRNSYVTPTDSRGWKLEVVLNNQVMILDPSIARYYFKPNGKTEFLRVVRQAFIDVALNQTDQ